MIVNRQGGQQHLSIHSSLVFNYLLIFSRCLYTLFIFMKGFTKNQSLFSIVCAISDLLICVLGSSFHNVVFVLLR